MTRRYSDPDPRSLRDQAVDWLVRVESDAATEADWNGLEAWLAQAPEHRVAYDEVEVMSAALADHREAISEGVAADEPHPGVVDLTSRLRSHDRPSRRVMTAAIGSAIAAALVGAFGIGLFQPTPTTVYRTARGETRQVLLEDGSRIDMNGDSLVRVRFERGARRVFLGDAEAAFDVAHDSRRPFVVEAGGQAVRVVGTQFNVRADAQDLTVTVRRGVVEVKPLKGPGTPARLTAGEQLRRRIGEPRSTVSAVAADDAFAWTSGRLVCRDRRLDEIVADLNRRLPVPITVEGRAASLRFTGVLVIDDEEAVLRTLEAYLPVRAARGSGAIRLESR